MQALTSHVEKLFDKSLKKSMYIWIKWRVKVNRQVTPRRDDHERGWSQYQEDDYEEEQQMRTIPNQSNQRRYENRGDDDF